MIDARIEALLRERIGLDIASVGTNAIERAVRQRMLAAGVDDAGDYARLVQTSIDELQELTEVVVIPETSFFRHAEAFTVLGRLAVEEWWPAHPAQTMRLLSFPCSTGEEPYSMAMAMLDRGLHAERFQIDAFDISSRALDRARRARYGRNSFRGTDLSYRDRYFREERREHVVCDEVRSRVRFDRRNVVEETIRPLDAPYDVIFCRNLLIYFDAETQERALRNLDAMLAADGTLFVGPAESFQV